MTRKEIAKEIERRQKNLEHLLWVASSKLTKLHRLAVDREIKEEQFAIAKLTLEFKGIAHERRYTGSATLEPRLGESVSDVDPSGG